MHKLLVCRAWHVLALSQPTLWTNLDLVRSRGWPAVGGCIPSISHRSTKLCSLEGRLHEVVVVEKVAAILTFQPRIQELVGREIVLSGISHC
jgi:hypothetical protein